MIDVCRTCNSSEHVGTNPNRPNGPWFRCWQCGALWDRDRTDLLSLVPVLALTAQQRAAHAQT
jgi:hypothetical protein